MWILVAVVMGLVTCVSVNLTRNYIYSQAIKNLKWKYSKGEKLIYHQSNCYFNRMVGCEVIARQYSTKFSKRNIPLYKVKAHVEGGTIWVIPENEFACTAKEYGDFPAYIEK